MSSYTQRCAGECKQVRGNTAFRFARGKGGPRHTVCRWCEEREQEKEKQIRATVRSLAVARKREGELDTELHAVRAEIRRMEFEAFALSRERQVLVDSRP